MFRACKVVGHEARCPYCNKKLSNIKEGTPVLGIYTVCPRCKGNVEIVNISFRNKIEEGRE